MQINRPATPLKYCTAPAAPKCKLRRHSRALTLNALVLVPPLPTPQLPDTDALNVVAVVDPAIEEGGSAQ